MKEKKRSFTIPTRKNKNGEVSIIRYKDKTRCLNIIGKVKVPFSVSNLNLSRIVKSVASFLFNFFPFLKKGRNSYISTYSIPEYFEKKKPSHITLTYDFTYVITAVDIPDEIILQTVLNRIEEIGELILDKLDEEMETAYDSG